MWHGQSVDFRGNMPNNNAQHLQEIEAHLDRLIESLKRGELPVNLQRTKEVFDPAIMAEVERLSIPIEKFIAIYNDVPNLFNAYAIDATITATSYDHADSPVTFERLQRGNYWLLPLAVAPDNAWLVPNPLKKIAFDRTSSVNLCFDLPKEGNQASFNLLQPALVKILPTVPLTWKLLEVGKIGAYTPTANPTSQSTRPPIPVAAPTESSLVAYGGMTEAEVERIVGRMINDRMSAITSGIESRLSGIGNTAKQQAALLIDRVKGHRDDDNEPKDNRRSGTRENKEPGDRLNTWKKSLTDFIAPKDD
jgi:hypothetical protein